MPTNDFIGFASSGGANIMSQADFAAAVEQTDGVQPGPASSKIANKVWRQGANMAAAMGEIIKSKGYDALDNGDIATLSNNLLKALLPETGTWTPVLRGSGIAGSFTYNKQSAIYYKIDKLIYVYGSISVSACTALPSGDLRITGLPYTAYGNSGGRIMTIFARGTGFDDDSAKKIIGFYVAGNSSILVSRVLETDTTVGMSTIRDGFFSDTIQTGRAVKVSVTSYTDTVLDFAGWYLAK